MVNPVCLPETNVVVPEMARLFNVREVTVTERVMVKPPNEAVMVAVPAATPVTLPLERSEFSTVAMALLSELHKQSVLNVTSCVGALLYEAVTLRRSLVPTFRFRLAGEIFRGDRS